MKQTTGQSAERVRLTSTQIAALRAAKAGDLRWSQSLVTYVTPCGYGAGINYRTGERLLTLGLISLGAPSPKGDRPCPITPDGEVALDAHRAREVARAERRAAQMKRVAR